MEFDALHRAIRIVFDCLYSVARARMPPSAIWARGIMRVWNLDHIYLPLLGSGAVTRRQLGSIYQQSNAAALLAHDAQLLPLWMEPINDANHGGHRHEEI